MRVAILQRRFLRPEGAEFWAYLFNQVGYDEQATAEVYKTWYGSKVVVWLSQE